MDPTPCPCGSGLRRLRCCALDLATLSPPAATAPVRPLLEQAEAALAERDNARAEAALLAALELAPGREDALFSLHRLLRQDGKIGAAEAILRRMVAVNPNNFAPTNELTLMLLARGALAEAEVHARNAVRIAPRSAQAHNLMGLVMTEANRALIGEYHYREVLRLLERDDAVTLANLAWNLKTQGRIEEARALYATSVKANPDVVQSVLGWTRTEEADRKFDRALELVEQAEALAPGNAAVALTRATVLARKGATEDALARLDRLGEGGTLGPAELSEKGRLLDRLGRYDEAFAAYDAGKARALALGARRYMDEAAQDIAARLRGFFTERRLATLPRATTRTDMPQPIFIVGFPRSGTTLIEQTLSVHPRIAAGDELPYINDATHLVQRLFASPLSYPDALCELWMGDQREGLDLLRDHYLARVRQAGILREGAAWFTDKMPLNETHLGLIHLMFPAAPIIHLLRHPLDVVLSVYSNHLTHGLFCAAELATIAKHYALTADLIAHYREHIPALRYRAVRYEDVVDHQEREIRGLLDFIGEDFDPACLQFEKNQRYARTASYAQVTEKLYDRSRFRYRHYRAQLDPVVSMLTPMIERLGYTIDDKG
ncbi:MULTISPECIES: tetratricopeptide repeat-containing sulfotransferase family protein [Acidiphilium]|uniref:Flp pilus assembly protein TadD, contains TPR repeats n=1 Tax=Acidiphilium rubrum TaxID=526 RepID=A0A8G2CMY9_ACIRU|nr:MULTISPECIES: sulfotransferase [Acidiphilium]SIR33810.1 Flp pilus assembly protein TadD, contains TPR repeats [Acidiphilium rubrum]